MHDRHGGQEAGIKTTRIAGGCMFHSLRSFNWLKPNKYRPGFSSRPNPCLAVFPLCSNLHPGFARMRLWLWRRLDCPLHRPQQRIHNLSIADNALNHLCVNLRHFFLHRRLRPDERVVMNNVLIIPDNFRQQLTSGSVADLHP